MSDIMEMLQKQGASRYLMQMGAHEIARLRVELAASKARETHLEILLAEARSPDLRGLNGDYDAVRADARSKALDEVASKIRGERLAPYSPYWSDGRSTWSEDDYMYRTRKILVDTILALKEKSDE